MKTFFLKKAKKVFLKLKKLLRIDLGYVLKGGFWLTVSQFFSSISSLLLVIAFAHFLPRETYGQYKYILSLIPIFLMFSLPGLTSALTQSVAREFDGSLAETAKSILLWSVFSMSASIFTGIYYYYQNNYLLSTTFFIISPFLLFLETSNLYTYFLLGKKLFKQNTQYTIISKIFSSFAVFASIYFTDNLIILIFTYYASNTILNSFFYFVTLKKHVKNNRIDRETITYGKHISVINLISTISNQLDKILVFHYLGAEELALYSFAVVPCEQIKGLFNSIATLALPKFSQRKISEIKNTIKTKMAFFTIALSGIVIIYILIAPFVYKILFPQYREAVFYSQIYSLFLLSLSLLLPFTALYSFKLTKQIYSFTIYTSIIQILLLFTGLHFFGFLGIIIARVLARFVNLFFSYTLFQKSPEN